MSNPIPAPAEIRLNAAKDTLTVSFGSGAAFSYTAEFLRVNSPSAEVKGHSAAERKVVGGKKFVTIDTIETVGNYAVRLLFSDGHSTGIYSWSYIYIVGLEQEKLWEQYLKELEERGLRREP